MFYNLHDDVGGFNMRTLAAPRNAARKYPKVLMFVDVRDSGVQAYPVRHNRPSLHPLTKIARRACSLPHSPRVTVIRSAECSNEPVVYRWQRWNCRCPTRF